MHCTYTNDDVDTLHLHLDGRVAYHDMHCICAHLSTAFHDAHLTFHDSSPEHFHISIHGHHHGAPSLTRFSTFYFYHFLLSVPFFLIHIELFPELRYTKCMANLRRSATNESEDTLDVFHPLTGYKPKAHDFDELYDSSVSFSLMIPSTDQDVDDLTLGEMLTQAYRGQVDSSVPGGMSVSSSSSVVVDRSGQPDVARNVVSAHSNFSEDIRIEQTHDRSGQPDERNSSNAQIRTLLQEQRQTIIAKKSVITNSKQLMQKKKSADFYEKNYGDSNWNFVKFINKVLQRWRNCRNSRFLPSIRSRDENPSRIKTLYWNLLARQQNEVNCMNDSKDFQDAESIRSGNSHVTQSTFVIPASPGTWGDVETFFRIAEPQRRAAKHLGHTWYIWKRFCKSTCIFSTLSSRIESMEFVNRRAAPFVHSEQNQNLRCRSGPLAKNPVIFSGRNCSKNYGADQQRLQMLDLHFDKFPTPATFSCRKIKYKTEVCICSQFPTEAMQWIKEVELVDSVDELRSSSSTRGISIPNFEVFDARIASALNKIIHNSHFKRSFSLEERKVQKQDRFLRGRQIAYLIYDYFRFTGSHEPCRELYRLIYYQSSKWRCSGIGLGTEFYCLWRKSRMMTSWKVCTN